MVSRWTFNYFPGFHHQRQLQHFPTACSRMSRPISRLYPPSPDDYSRLLPQSPLETYPAEVQPVGSVLIGLISHVTYSFTSYNREIGEKWDWFPFNTQFEGEISWQRLKTNFVRVGL